MKLHGSYYDDDLVSALQGAISYPPRDRLPDEAQVKGRIVAAAGFASGMSR